MPDPKPVIGIVTYGRNEDDEFYLPAAYVEAVRAAGGLPILLLPGEERLEELLHWLDGLILAGGGDIDPRQYGGPQHPSLDRVDPERDRTELALARLAVERDLPTFGICRGLQLLNVAFGGDLVVHIPDVFGEKVVHHRPPHKAVDHPVRVAPESRLAEIVGRTEVVVRSWHHQALKRLGRGLRPVAWAADGVVEAFEADNPAWLVGVQWHPELTASTDPCQQRLFAAFVEAARRHRNESNK